MAPTPKQLAMLHVAKKQLGLDDAAYRAILAGAAQVDSAKELDAWGFEQVVEAFKSMGFEARFVRRKSDFGDRDGMATPAQVAKLRKLWLAYAGNDDDKQLSKWLQTTFKLSALRFLPFYTAIRAIEALKVMVARQGRKEVQDGV